MPRATAVEVKERFDLETCPGGYVVLRKFNYGENLRRRELMASVRRDRSSDSSDDDIEMRANVTAVQAYEFKAAILEHNLEDETGRTLNFSNVKDIASLDGSIAGEIEELIDRFNRPEEEPSGDPFKSKPGEPSSTEKPSTPGSSTPST